MVHPKKSKNWLMETLQEAKESLGKPIDKRYYVLEFTPSVRYPQDNGHGGREWVWSRERHVRVSPFFSTRAVAQEWLDRHEAEEGSQLRIREQTLYERVVREWH